MSRTIFSLPVFLSLAAASLPAAAGQAGQTTQQTQTSSPTPSQSSTAAPAPQSTSSQPNTGTPSATPDKKVWTNEDVGDLRDHDPISIGGAPAPPKKPATNKPAAAQTAAQNAKAKRYIDQINALQAKLPPLDDKIQQLQAALNGDQVNGVRHYGWTSPDDWRDQLQRLQKQREDLQAKISELEDQARHDGVPANEVP
jgi:hypothetical protein